MSKHFVKIEGDIVVQSQPNSESGFKEVHSSIVCGMVHDGSTSYAKTAFSLPAPVYDFSEELKKIRDAKIYGGITVGGISLDTDETTQNRLTGMVVKAEKDSQFSVNWVVDNSTVTTLDAATIIALGDAVVDHIQKCFNAFISTDLTGITTIQGLEAAYDAEYAQA